MSDHLRIGDVFVMPPQPTVFSEPTRNRYRIDRFEDCGPHVLAIGQLLDESGQVILVGGDALEIEAVSDTWLRIADREDGEG